MFEISLYVGGNKNQNNNMMAGQSIEISIIELGRFRFKSQKSSLRAKNLFSSNAT